MVSLLHTHLNTYDMAKQFVPEIGQKYFFIDPWGQIDSNYFGMVSIQDEYLASIGNMHETKEDALVYKITQQVEYAKRLV